MALITQTEIINSVRVDDHFSVNNITDDTIQKAELYLAGTFLGNRFYDSLQDSKTDVGTFDNSDYQILYDRYLKRLVSEYVIFMSIDEIVLRAANNGLNNDDQLTALQYVKESFRDEVERSKAMIDSFLISNKTSYLLYAGNLQSDETTKVKKGSYFGFVSEEILDDDVIFDNRNNLIL